MVINALVKKNTHIISDYELSPSHDDYHLQFVNYPQEGGFGDQEINLFLKKIFRGSSPLEYVHHQPAQSYGKPAVLVRFKLSTAGQLRNISFNDAGRELCRLIFQKESRNLLSIVTGESILGVSAVSATWRGWFTNAFFAAGVGRGPPILEEIVTAFKGDYLPLWALVFAFTVVGNLNIGAFVGAGAMAGEGHSRLLGVLGVRYATQILEGFATSRSVRPRDQIEREWKLHHNRYKVCMEKSIQMFSQCTRETTSMDTSGMSPAAQLCDTLYVMAESASIVLTSNQELLKSFIQGCDMANRERILATAGIPVSFGMVTGAIGVIAEDAALIAASAEACIVPGVALIAGVAGTIYCVVKVRQKIKEARNFNKRILYHERMRDFIIQSWQLAADSEQFLKWVHCTNMAQPTRVEWLDQETNANWQQFLTVVRQGGGDAQATMDTVRVYLGLREDALRRICDAVEEADREAFPGQ